MIAAVLIVAGLVLVGALALVALLVTRLVRSRTQGVSAVAVRSDLAAVRAATPPANLAALVATGKTSAVQAIRSATGLSLRQSVLMYELAREGKITP